MAHEIRCILNIQNEIEKLDRTIRDSGIRLQTINMNIISISKEIDNLLNFENQLEENIRCLKQKNIIAIAVEFKKAKEELGKARARSLTLKNDRENFRKAVNEINKLVKKSKEDMAKLNLSKDRNVLQGKFKRKTDG